MEDRAVIDGLRSGDRDAFGLLVSRETGAVYRACLRVLGRPSDAEDIAQESFVAAYRAIHTYRGDGSPRAWLLADPDADPSVRVVAGEQRARVRAAVAALPDPYREVVALRFFADLSLFEVAEATGRPINTVKTHLRRGLQRLRPIVRRQEVAS